MCPRFSLCLLYMSHGMRFPTIWYVRPAKAQTSLRIRADWSEPLLVAWLSYECSATDWKSFRVSKLNRRLHRLVWVYTCQNATLLEITCHGSYVKCKLWFTSVHTCLWNVPGVLVSSMSIDGPTPGVWVLIAFWPTTSHAYNILLKINS